MALNYNHGHQPIPHYDSQDDFYEKSATPLSSTSTPPPLPQHINTHDGSADVGDQYAMRDVSMLSPSPYFDYNSNNHSGSNSPLAPPPPIETRYSDQSRASLSDMKFVDHYDSDDDLEKIIPRERRKRTCCDKMCCGCCTCCPKWLRFCTCIIFIIILCLAIVVGVLAGLFKVPTITYSGMDDNTNVTNSNGVLNLAFKFDISINNPNFESITFETIKAEAYYPSPYNVYIGGGSINNVHINSNGFTNITFPFQVSVNSSDPNEQGVLMDLLTRCGLDGSAAQNINFNYYVKPTVRIAGIAITPTISESMSIKCPITNGDLTGLLGSSF